MNDRFAQVIVDVPAKPTDRPFDYRIPSSLHSWVSIGSRVSVPFAGRVLQGIVIGLADETETDIAKVKEIEGILDAAPPLTEELVELSGWMSARYACSRLAALQAMLPGALKAKYETNIRLRSDPPQGVSADKLTVRTPEEEAILAIVRAKTSVPLESLLQAMPQAPELVKRLLADGVLTIERTVKDRIAKKTALTVFAQCDPKQLRELEQSLPSRSAKQKAVLLLMAQRKENGSDSIALAELISEHDIGPSAVKALADRGWLDIREAEVDRDPYAGRTFAATSPLPLNAEQEAALAPIAGALESCEHRSFLLHGVTGSGKTEVYLQAIAACLGYEREAIVLVPEIALTPQMVERFKGRFGEQVAVLHSRLSQGERYDEWRRIAEGRAKVAVGARSAIFAPFRRLGLIIIDEEHESSYKQEETPKYHARDVALERGRMCAAPVVLGSATPSLESYRSALLQGGKGHTLLTMLNRALGGAMPAVQIVDMRDQLKSGNRSMFSGPLHAAMEQRLARGEQMVLLLNRRGYSTFVMCRSCGQTSQCPHCDIALTYHQNTRHLRCHYCGYAQRQPEACPSCGSPHIRYFGTGTQRVEEELAKLFPGIRVIRMDVDTTSEKGAHEKWLTQFRERKADVLLGTQMVAKGLDFPYVTLVGVIAADTVLHIPDFRAAERTFQLLTQVAGRAGRHHLPGEVIIQTYSPEHYSVEAASRHDYGAFVRLELEQRRQRLYPPFCRLILVTVSHTQLPVVIQTADHLAAGLKSAWGLGGGASRFEAERLPAEVFGPVASPIPRIKDRYRFQVLIKTGMKDERTETVRRVVDSALERMHKGKAGELQISIDVDPYVLL